MLRFFSPTRAVNQETKSKPQRKNHARLEGVSIEGHADVIRGRAVKKDGHRVSDGLTSISALFNKTKGGSQISITFQH